MNGPFEERERGNSFLSALCSSGSFGQGELRDVRDVVVCAWKRTSLSPSPGSRSWFSCAMKATARLTNGRGDQVIPWRDCDLLGKFESKANEKPMARDAILQSRRCR